MLCVMCWERVFGETCGTGPSFKSVVDFRIRVQHSLACFARHWRILHKSHIFDVLHRCVNASDRHNYSRSADLVARPEVPTEPDAILLFSLVKLHKLLSLIK